MSRQAYVVGPLVDFDMAPETREDYQRLAERWFIKFLVLDEAFFEKMERLFIEAKADPNTKWFII